LSSKRECLHGAHSEHGLLLVSCPSGSVYFAQGTFSNPKLSILQSDFPINASKGVPMSISEGVKLVLSVPDQTVRVVRFAAPDLREQLDDNTVKDGCALLQDLKESVLDAMAPGHTLVLNLGLIERFPTALYRCLLGVREAVLARNARLLLCRVSPEHREIFQLFKGDRLFTIMPTEAQAVAGCVKRPWPDEA
jgi:anti-anti-sigma regulatory factor